MTTQSLVACSNAGVAECEFHLAQMTETGTGVTKDLDAAKLLYEKAYRGGIEEAARAVLRLTRLEKTPAPIQIGKRELVAASTLSSSATPALPPVSLLGISYGANGAPIGFGHASFEQTDSEFDREFSSSECVHNVDSWEERCDATFKINDQFTRIAAWFSKGHMIMMAQVLRAGCSARAADLGKNMAPEDRDSTMIMVGEFLPSGVYKFSHSASISAWSTSDALHALTICEPWDSGMVVLIHQSLDEAKARMKTRAAQKR